MRRASTRLAAVLAGLAAVRLLAATPSPAPAGTPPVAAGPVTVTARASATEVSVGQPFTVDVEASGPAGATFTFPEEAGDEKVELRAAPPPENALPAPGRRRYLSTAFALDEVAVPAITVAYRLADGASGRTASAPIVLHIVSLLPKDEAGRQPADIRPPVGVPIGAPFWLACSLAGAGLAGLAVWLVRRRRPGAAPPAREAPPVPPDVEARAALDRLGAGGLLEAERSKEFYVALAEIAKRYLERRLDAAVLEMTSSETLAFLKDHPLARDLAPPVRDLVATADLVKFARGAAAAETGQRHLAAVRAMVDALEARLAAAGDAAAPSGQRGEAA